MVHFENRKYLLCYFLNLVFVLFGIFMNFYYDWPDYVHTDYGFPFIWATHTTISIAGPVNNWNIDLVNLFLDIIVWLFSSFLIFMAYLRIAKKFGRSL